MRVGLKSIYKIPTHQNTASVAFFWQMSNNRFQLGFNKTLPFTLNWFCSCLFNFQLFLFLFIDRKHLFCCIIKHFQINLIITPWKLIMYQDHHSWLTLWCSEPVSTSDVCQLYHCSSSCPSMRRIFVFVGYIWDACNVFNYCPILWNVLPFDAPCCIL